MALRRALLSSAASIADHAQHCVMGAEGAYGAEKTQELMAAAGRLVHRRLSMAQPRPFLPALRFDALTRFYDAIVAVTTREAPSPGADSARGRDLLRPAEPSRRPAARIKPRSTGARVVGILHTVVLRVDSCEASSSSQL